MDCELGAESRQLAGSQSGCHVVARSLAQTVLCHLWDAPVSFQDTCLFKLLPVGFSYLQIEEAQIK